MAASNTPRAWTKPEKYEWSTQEWRVRVAPEPATGVIHMGFTCDLKRSNSTNAKNLTLANDEANTHLDDLVRTLESGEILETVIARLQAAQAIGAESVNITELLHAIKTAQDQTKAMREVR